MTIGGASGYWGDAPGATAQLLAHEGLDFLVYDYLAEITLSILARARGADPAAGYATDFVTAAMAPNLATIAARGVRVVSNAGGVNPDACAQALRSLIRESGLSLKVAVVRGDDLSARVPAFAGREGSAPVQEMFSGERFPAPERVASVNAYLGAFPIAAALDHGADIVITGRCVDSAVTLGACVHHFGWAADDLDRLAQGSLAGHILECGTQATGGNFTDWEAVADGLWEAGYPIAEVAADGNFTVTRPDGSGGQVSVGTLAEQMLYEIGDPRCYI
ncbi:MAG: acyclic terpene utilization AtuA family protein, partial [Chromatocurvus sp.]